MTKITTTLLSVCMFCLGQTFAAEESVSDNEEQSVELTREEFRMNRGLVELSTEIVPKGQWVVGATGSYSAHKNDNYTLFVVDGINSQGYSVNITSTVSYAFKANMTGGLRFKYGRSLLRIYDAGLSIGGEDGTQITVNDFYALEHSYIASAVVRQYIPLGGAKRFALFADMEFEGGGFQSKFANDEPVKGTFSRGYTMGLGISPGIVAFATNDVAIEVSVGMLGVGYTHTDQAHNQVSTGEVNYSSMNFKINLLTIGLGVSIYL